MTGEHIKLTYFNARGRVEAIRYLLHYAGVDFEDHRIQRDQWPAIKNDFPTKQMPVLEFTDADGKKMVLTQSIAIGRFLAIKYKLYGTSHHEETLCDEVLDTLLDVGGIAALSYYEEDPERKAKLHGMLKTQLFPVKLGYLEKKLKENGGKHIVGSEWTMADFTIACVMRTLRDYAGAASGEIAENFPGLDALAKSVDALPKIADYISTRPNTDR